MDKATKTNHIFRVAVLDLIADCVRRNHRRVYTDEGYENKSQMVHFIHNGNHCILRGVDAPNVEKGTLNLLVEVTKSTKPPFVKSKMLYSVELFAEHFRCATLERIACEVYDNVRNAFDDEFDIALKDKVAEWTDTLYKEL